MGFMLPVHLFTLHIAQQGSIYHILQWDLLGKMYGGRIAVPKKVGIFKLGQLWTIKIASPVHNVYIGQYDSPVSEIAL